MCGVAAAPSQLVLRRRYLVEGCFISATSEVLSSKHRPSRPREGVTPRGWAERHAKNRPRKARQRDLAQLERHAQVGFACHSNISNELANAVAHAFLSLPSEPKGQPSASSLPPTAPQGRTTYGGSDLLALRVPRWTDVIFRRLEVRDARRFAVNPICLRTVLFICPFSCVFQSPTCATSAPLQRRGCYFFCVAQT